MNAKKQARRNAAANRFSILSRDAWLRENINKSSDGKFDRFDRRVGAGVDGHDKGYDAYVAAKQVEKAALGCNIN